MERLAAATFAGFGAAAFIALHIMWRPLRIRVARRLSGQDPLYRTRPVSPLTRLGLRLFTPSATAPWFAGGAYLAWPAHRTAINTAAAGAAVWTLTRLHVLRRNDT